MGLRGRLANLRTFRPRVSLRGLGVLIALAAVGMSAWRWFDDADPVRVAALQAQSGRLADRRQAVFVLAASDQNDAAVAHPALLAALSDTDPEVRRTAARGLARLWDFTSRADRVGNKVGSDPPSARVTSMGREAVAALTIALADADPHVRVSAVDALYSMLASWQSADLLRPPPTGQPSVPLKPVVEGLISLLADPDAGVRERTALTLGGMADALPAAPPAALVAATSDRVPEVRCAAAVAVLKFDRDAAELVPTIIRLAADPALKSQQFQLLYALDSFRLNAPPTPELLALLADPNPVVRGAAAAVIGKSAATHGELADGFIEALAQEVDRPGHPDLPPQFDPAVGLTNLLLSMPAPIVEPRSKVLPLVIRGLKSSDPTRRLTSAVALQHATGAPDLTVPPLIERVLKETEPAVLEAVAAVLVQHAARTPWSERALEVLRGPAQKVLHWDEPTSFFTLQPLTGDDDAGGPGTLPAPGR